MKTCKKIKISIKYILILLLIFILFMVLRNIGIEIPCVFHKVTGFYCPGCGITRMFIALLSGNIYQAFRFNPFIFILLPILGIYYLYRYVCWFRDIKYYDLPNWFWYTLLVLAIIFMILRNIPYFSFLKPTII